jgi:hypothetical protein
VRGCRTGPPQLCAHAVAGVKHHGGAEGGLIGAEMLDALRSAIPEKAEILHTQSAHILPLVVHDGDVDENQLRCQAQGVFFRGCGPLRQKRAAAQGTTQSNPAGSQPGLQPAATFREAETTVV